MGGNKINTKPKIWTDFNNCDERGFARLSTVGSLRSLKQISDRLLNGLQVVLIQEGEFEVEAILQLDESKNIWLGIPDWKTMKRMDE